MIIANITHQFITDINYIPKTKLIFMKSKYILLFVNKFFISFKLFVIVTIFSVVIYNYCLWPVK
jgi:hypothetical protein